MKKDAYYFSHDANAQDDPKIMLLIDQMGMEGYGIFWALIEKLRAEKNFMLPLCVCNAFAKRWGTSKEKVETVINAYNLFKIHKEYFFSDRLKKSMQEKSAKARLSASIRWGTSERNAIAYRTQSDGNAIGMRKDAIKGKERKEKNNNANSHFSDEKKQPVLHKGQTLRDKEVLEKMKNDPNFDPFDDTPTGEVDPPGEGMVW